MTEMGGKNQKAVPKWLSEAGDKIADHMNLGHSNSIVSTLHAQFGIKNPMAEWKISK